VQPNVDNAFPHRRRCCFVRQEHERQELSSFDVGVAVGHQGDLAALEVAAERGPQQPHLSRPMSRQRFDFLVTLTGQASSKNRPVHTGG